MIHVSGKSKIHWWCFEVNRTSDTISGKSPYGVEVIAHRIAACGYDCYDCSRIMIDKLFIVHRSMFIAPHQDLSYKPDYYFS